MWEGAPEWTYVGVQSWRGSYQRQNEVSPKAGQIEARLSAQERGGIVTAVVREFADVTYAISPKRC